MSLEENFNPIWRRFLEMEIIRSQYCLKFAGSANAYLVLQVICWHHLLLVTENQAAGSYEATVDNWFASQTGVTKTNKKLTYALISDLTGLDKETVRRNVKMLEKAGFASADRKSGVMYTPTPEINDRLVNDLNVKEVGLVKRFASTLARYDALGIADQKG
ncbi:MAG: hypothetical protein CNE93_01330 [SAR116 cluster bacterium MED-G06]|nr:MAG: hypothetical protein CNE93_01330 [SAR116 cluster bacterium MED-G06]